MALSDILPTRKPHRKTTEEVIAELKQKFDETQELDKPQQDLASEAPLPREEVGGDGEGSKASDQTLLGAYEVVKITRRFPHSFWITIEHNGTLVMETEGDGFFTIGYIKRVDLEKALERGEVMRGLEL